MPQKLGFMNQWLFGEWADRAAINRNAEDLSAVEADVTELRATVQRQSQEILRLRAMFMGVVEVLHAKTPFDDAELERAVQEAWTSLTAPPSPPPKMATLYRDGAPSEPSPADVDAAKALLAAAQDHHFSRRFGEARAIYQQIIDQYGTTKQAAIARQQLENLRRA